MDTSLWARLSKSALTRYLIAVGVTAFGLLARWGFDPILRDSTPWSPLYPGIAFLAIYLGLGPSVVATILSLLGTIYFFMQPRGTFQVQEIQQIVSSAIFLIVCACIIAAGEASRRSRTKLQHSENLFESFLDNSPGAEFLKDEEGRYIYSNITTTKRFGKEFTGKTDFELFPGGTYSEQWRRNDLQVLRENKALEFLENSVHEDGEHTWLTVKFPVVDAEGRKLLGGKSIDITQQMRAQEEARAASELLRGFVNAVPTGLTRCSRDLRYLMVNPAYAELAGLPVEQIVGRPIVDVMGRESWQKIKPYVEQVLRGERVEYELLLPFAGVDSRCFHVAYMPERDSSGQVVGWVAAMTEMTEFKRVQAQLHKVEKLAAAGQLAASLAHEINNPLSAVTNALYLLKTSSHLDDSSSTLAKAAASELDRVARIVRQSLSYYRVGMTAKELDLATTVEESLQIYGEKFQRAGIQLTKNVTPKTLMMGFPDEIRQVIDNLLLNALEATPSGGRLAVSVRWSRDWGKQSQGGVRLTIADSGQGIPRHQLTRIFEPFFTTKAERGTGLGLWVVHGIVAKHDARIKFRSTANEGRSGTVISILWPSSRWHEQKEKMARSGSAA